MPQNPHLSSVHFLSAHLHLGSDVCRAALRPPADLWLLLWQSRRAPWSAQHRAGRQLGACSRVTEGLFGEAERRRLGRACFGLHHQDGRREDGDWRKRGEESMSWGKYICLSSCQMLHFVHQLVAGRACLQFSSAQVVHCEFLDLFCLFVFCRKQRPSAFKNDG